jgi:hypothetical protein
MQRADPAHRQAQRGCRRERKRLTESAERVDGSGLRNPLMILYVLIYQNRVSIRIDNHKASRASRAFVCFCNHVYATIFELALQLSNVREFSELLSIATPARVEGENVLIEHALKQPNSVVAILMISQFCD